MKLIFSRAAVHDLVRLRDFIAHHSPEAAQRVAQRLRGTIQRLVDTPQIGRPVANMPSSFWPCEINYLKVYS